MSRKIPIFILVLAWCLAAIAQKKPATTAQRPAQNKPTTSAERNAYPIIELITSGSERYDAEDVLKYTGLKVDKKIEAPLEDVRAAAQKLVDSGAFLEVNYKHTASSNGATSGMKVEFILSDKDDDQFVKCDFANIVWLPEKDLLVELHDRVPLFNGTVPRNGTLADDVAKALQAVLKERGIVANVANEHEDPVNGDPATELVIYRVTDVDIKVAKVELAGASEAMQAEGAVVSKQIIGLVYNRATVEKFIEHNLRNVFLRRGHLRATFGAPEIKVLPDSGGVTNVAINIPVTEGQTYKAGAVRWSGNQAMLAESLTPYLHLTTGTVVDGAQLQKDIDKLRYHYASLGYLHMRLTPKPEFDDAAGVVDYEMPVREGDLFSMGKFEVEGLAPASASKVTQAWQLREGEPFDPMYLNDFFKKFRMPAETGYIVDEVEGERPRSVDVTVIFCKPGDPCKPKNENRLYTPPPSVDEDK